MIQRSLFLVFVFYSLYANGQESSDLEVIDSSLWELVIPVEITENRQVVGNIINLSRKDFLTMPASFDDPSRLLMKFPGFTNANDQNNGIIYHGMPSHYSGWSINGAEILNPNHLSSAGRLFDIPAAFAGGVNAFSGQVLGDYTYRSNPDIFTSSNYIAGTSDMAIRSPYRNQVTLNTSLIGIEGGLDLKHNKWSFLSNYRYSTVGLLADFGLDFGDEKITYQDVIFKLKYTNPVGWNMELFQLYGINRNEKIRPDIPIEEFTSLEQFTQKKLRSKVIIGGVKINKELGSGYFESSINVSHLIDDTNYDPIAGSSNEESLTLISNNTSYTQTKNKGQVEINIKSSFYNIPYNSIFETTATLQSSLIQPGVFFKYSPTLRWHFNLGVHQNYYQVTELDIEESAISPKLGLTWISKDYRYKSSAKYNFTQQFFKRLTYNEPLHFPKSHNFSVELADSKSNITTQIFYHYITNITQDGFGLFYDSGLNDTALQNFGDFGFYTDDSNASIYGMSISYTEEINSNTSISGNVTLSHGRQKFQYFNTPAVDPKSTKIPLLSRYISNISLSRKKLWLKNLDLQLSMHYKSGRNFKENLDDDLDRKIPFYFRGDLRLNYHFRKKSDRFKSFLSLDIQNFTNRQNASYYFYDPFAQEETLETQLGIIPVLSWRVVI